ncbi:MAG: HIT domain-containing protein [Candidatus Ancillula sp.]|jgi:histidine triad (HIT) family protein|nr:HIT domain-containing protein [Candidatus Ancillula sp.]
MTDCLFCKIAKGEIPSDIVYQDEKMIVFKDINPQAEVHLVGIPREHYINIVELTHENITLAQYFLSKMAEVGSKMSGGNGIDNGQFKLLFNTGEKIGQSVFHVHAHILAGKINEDARV